MLVIISVFFFSAFMTHTKSAFIWEHIEILKFTQFPWRFLAVVVFSTSLISAYVIESVLEKYKVIVLSLLILLIVFLNWNYFKPDRFYPLINDQQKLSGVLWEDQIKAALLDYLPSTAVKPNEPAPNHPLLITGEAHISNFVNKSNYWKFDATVLKNSKIDLPVFDFPNWLTFVNNNKISHNNDKSAERIEILLSPGNYKVEGRFTNTGIRTISNLFSLLSFCMLIFISTYGKSIFKKLE